MTLAARDQRERTLAERLRDAFNLMGELAAVGAFITMVTFASHWLWFAPELARSELAVTAESAALAGMLGEEIALRGYLATRDPRFREAYLSAERQQARANSELTSVVGSASGLASALVAERIAKERWTEKWAKIAAETGPLSLAPSMAEGDALLDAYRREQAALALLLDRQRDTSVARAHQVLATGVVLNLALFFAALVLAVRQRRALHDSIVRPVMFLLQNIGRIRDGRLEGTVPLVAPRELYELGEGLNDMARALTQARDAALSRDATLRQHTAQLRQILDASREFSESLDLPYVARAVRESIVAIGGYERVTLWLMDQERERLVDSETMRCALPASNAPDGAISLAGRAIKSGRVTLELAAGQLRVGDNDLGPVRALATPLIVGARIVGALEVRNAEVRIATREMIDVLETLAMHAATALEAARLHQIAEEHSQIDALTQLLNRRRLDQDLDVECKRCQRYARPLAFVMLDVDHFKQFNDCHGHPAADTALREVARIVVDCMRTTDTAYRYGGEEFCVILRETTGLDAMHFAERVRHRIEEHFTKNEVTPLTASFGVADFSADRPMPHELLTAADAAMYQSKHAGRNRVILSSRPPFALNGDFEAQPVTLG